MFHEGKEEIIIIIIIIIIVIVIVIIKYHLLTESEAITRKWHTEALMY